MPLSNLYMSDTSNEEYILLALIFIVILAILYNLWHIYSHGHHEKKHKPSKNASAELRLYYAPWCGHSTMFIENGWKRSKQLIENDNDLNKHVNVREIDCENPNNTDKCTSAGIVGFPTVRLFSNGKEIEYTGDRTEKSIINFLKNNL